MALGFFRRRQKLVLIVMVLLMVAFLIPSMFQGFGRGGPSKEVLGHIGDKEITQLTRRMASVDLDLLRTSLKLGQFSRPRRGEIRFREFYNLNARMDPPLTWALLLQEARDMDITVTEDQVEAFFAESGLIGDLYKQEVANLRQSRYGYTEKQLRGAVAHYLMIMAASETIIVNTPASVPELRHTFADLQERIRLVMVTFEADDYTADVPDPSIEQIVPWFEKYKSLVSRHPFNKTEFGFGYLQPNRLDVAYLFLDRNSVARAVEPSAEQMELYWRKHGGKLKIKVPIPTTRPAPSDHAPEKDATRKPPVRTRPAGDDRTTATGPTTKPAESTDEPKFREFVTDKYTEAKPHIRLMLKDRAVEKGMDEIISLARQAAGRFADTEEPYSAAVAAMIRPADALLSQKVPALSYKEAPLETVIEELEILTDVKIVYPFGRHDKFTLDGKVVVRIEPWKNITLGEALERIRKDNKKMDLPPIKWVTCEGFKKVIFPSEPVSLVPVSAGRTGMVGLDEIRSHELLGWTGLNKDPAQARQSVLSIAVTAEVFQGSGRKKHESLIKQGSDFDRAMYVFGRRRGRLLWRLVNAKVAHVPQNITDEIRKEVVRDIKIFHGFKKALAAAEAMKTDVDKKNAALEKIAEAGKRESTKTELFSRKILDRRTGGMYWSYLPEVGQNPKFLDTVFRLLVPDDPDGPHKDRPTAVAPLPRRRKVMLVQRIGYEPVRALDFDLWGANYAGEILATQRLVHTIRIWFDGKNVAARVMYVPKF